jgi:hypothetical protein
LAAISHAEEAGANTPAGSFSEASMLGTILIILLILALLGAFPRWGWSRGWGYFPSGGLGLILIIVVILVLLGRL